jgi:ATP-binding cassette, subfamily B, bacterial
MGAAGSARVPLGYSVGAEGSVRAPQAAARSESAPVDPTPAPPSVIPAPATVPPPTPPTGATPASPAGTWRTLRRFIPFLRPVRGLIVLGIVLSVLQAVFRWISPWPLKLIFDSVLGTVPLPSVLDFLPAGPQARLATLAIGMVVIALALGITSFLSTFWLAHAGQRLVYDVRVALFRHLEAQSLAFHQGRTTGDLMSRLSGDAQALQSLMIDAVPTLLNNVLTMVGIAVIMFMVDWRFALLTLAFVPVLHISIKRLIGGLKTAVRQARRQEGVASGVAQEVLSSIAAVQVFGREADEAGRFADATAAGLAATRQAISMQSGLTTVAGGIMALGTVPVVWIGALAILAGQLTIGELLLFTSYLRATYTPIRQVAKLAIVFGQGLAAAERIAEILDTTEEVVERPHAHVPYYGRGRLTFDHVTHQYGPGRPALIDVDLDVPGGTQLAVVGATGSGKSTLVRLIPRFYDPTAGSIRLDGDDLRDLTLDGLRASVAMVTQEPYIFRGTVWENIAYGASGPSLSRKAAIAAARAAGVDAVLERLAEGYDTVISERGATLSGGQRQCISVARAMARDPLVLVLDEPTTGLDAEAESLLLAALKRLADGRTTIVVSHQIGAVQGAHQIVRLDHGRVMERGTNEQLLAARSGYWRLHSAQASRLTPAGEAHSTQSSGSRPAQASPLVTANGSFSTQPGRLAPATGPLSTR